MPAGLAGKEAGEAKNNLSRRNDLVGFGALGSSLASADAISRLEDCSGGWTESELHPAHRRRSFRKKRIPDIPAGIDSNSMDSRSRNSTKSNDARNSNKPDRNSYSSSVWEPTDSYI